MLKTKLEKPAHAGEEWDWAVANGKIFPVTVEQDLKKGKRFDVLLLGAADYVAINIDAEGKYNEDAPLRLFSVNGDFRLWIERGAHGPIKGVRWEVVFDPYKDQHHTQHWRIQTSQKDRLAIERIMGEITDENGVVS